MDATDQLNGTQFPAQTRLEAHQAHLKTLSTGKERRQARRQYRQGRRQYVRESMQQHYEQRARDPLYQALDQHIASERAIYEHAKGMVGHPSAYPHVPPAERERYMRTLSPNAPRPEEIIHKWEGT
jgi:hypothetical protein